MTAERVELVNAFLNGAITMGHATAGLFFLRFWLKTHDRLFVLFAVAFWMLGVIRVVMTLLGEPGQEHSVFWFRLVAYVIFLAAIVDKNWRKA